MRPIRDFLAGVGYLGRGLAMWVRSPGLLALGVIPAVIAAVILIVALGFFWTTVDDIVSGLTGFADGWNPKARDAVRFLAGGLLVGGSALVGVLVFTALTLTIGDPFYEKISERVEEAHGGVRGEVSVPWLRSLWQAIVDGLRLIVKAALFGIVLFGLGFIPVIGQTVVPVLGAMIGGWFLSVELTASTFQRRGIQMREQRQILQGRRPLAVGFGMATFVLFLVPLGAILVTPAAVAGATLLARELLGENTRVQT